MPNFEMTDYKADFARMGAVYERPDLPGAPHIKVIKSSFHTESYFNSDYAEQYPDVMAEIAAEWAARLEEANLVPDRVIGHAAYAVIPAQALAVALRERRHNVLVGYSKQSKDPKRGYETSFPVRSGEKVVVVADDVVTGNSTISTARNVKSKGGIILPVVPCLADLSNTEVLDWDNGEPPAEYMAASTFKPERYRTKDRPCDLCRTIGSAALEPREEDNWEEKLLPWMPGGEAWKQAQANHV